MAKQWVIRHYYEEDKYETLGIATADTAEVAILAFLDRAENKNETRPLTADEIIEVDNGTT